MKKLKQLNSVHVFILRGPQIPRMSCPAHEKLKKQSRPNCCSSFDMNLSFKLTAFFLQCLIKKKKKDYTWL